MTITADNIGDSFSFRAKHVSSDENFSISYATDGITTEEIPLKNIYAADDYSVYLINGWGGIQKTVYTWLPSRHREFNHRMAWGEGRQALYRLTSIAMLDIENTDTFLQRIDLMFEEVAETIELNSVSLAQTVNAMTYWTSAEGEDVFICHDGDTQKIFSVSTSGVANEIGTQGGISCMARDSNGYIRCGYGINAELKVLNPNDATMNEEMTLTLSMAGVNYENTTAIVNFNNTIYVGCQVTIGEDTEYRFGSVDLETGVVTSLGNLSRMVTDLASVSIDSVSYLICQTKDSLTSDADMMTTSLYELNSSTGARTDFIMRFAVDEHDETGSSNAVAYNEEDGRIYHLVKRFFPGDPEVSVDEDAGYRLVLESIDPYTFDKRINFVALPPSSIALLMTAATTCTTRGTYSERTRMNSSLIRTPKTRQTNLRT